MSSAVEFEPFISCYHIHKTNTLPFLFNKASETVKYFFIDHDGSTHISACLCWNKSSALKNDKLTVRGFTYSTRTNMRVLECPTLYLPSDTFTMGNWDGTGASAYQKLDLHTHKLRNVIGMTHTPLTEYSKQMQPATLKASINQRGEPQIKMAV